MRGLAVLSLVALLSTPTWAQITIDTVTPSVQSFVGGTPFTITGSGFPTGSFTYVLVNGQSAGIVSLSPTQIQAVAPYQSSGVSGPVELRVGSTSPASVGIAPGAITIVTPLEIDAVSPIYLLANTAGQSIQVTGNAFSPAIDVLIFDAGEFWEQEALSWIDVETVDAELRPFPPGTYDVTVRAQRTVGTFTDVLPLALTFLQPLQVADVLPGPYSFLGGELVPVIGLGFSPQTTATVAGLPAAVTYVSDEEVIVQIPSNPDAVTGEPVDLVLTDPVSGTDSYPISYIAEFTATGVDPVFVPAGVTTTVDVFGTAFNPTTTVSVNEVPGTVTFIDSTHLEVVVPALDPGIYDVTVVGAAPGIRETVTLPAQLSYYGGPPQVTAVDPPVICATRSEFITVIGEDFLPVTQLYLNGIVVPRARVHQEGTRITANAPAGLVGPVEVTVQDARGTDIDSSLLTRTDDCPTRERPQQIETSLAHGVARISWFNPEPYTSIEIVDTAGAVIATLPGTATRFETTVPPGIDEFQVGIVGYVEGEHSELVEALAKILECDYPPPLEGAVEPSSLGLTLRGGGLADPVDLCSDGAGPQGPFVVEVAGQFTELTQPGSVIPDWAAELLDTSRLVTGFTLDEPAERLELSAFYRKLAPAFGLSLRARLIHVYPDDGFVDEITLPDPFVGEERTWHPVTYYRATGDLGSDPSAGPCLDAFGEPKLIPAGEYRLELYVVGGLLGQPHYEVATDPRDDEIFIEGTPCPPYPMVRVRDLSGFRTLPNVTNIAVEGANELPSGKVSVELSARGTWIDSQGQTWSIDPFCDTVSPVTVIGDTFVGTGGSAGTTFFVCTDPEYQEPPLFDYCWTIYATEPAQCRIDRGAQGAILHTTLPDWGCYPIELTITDVACGTSRTFFREVAVYPDDPDLCDPSEPGYTFRFPTPDPGSVYVIGNMKNPTPGDGVFQGTRRLDTRVLVVPKDYCIGVERPSPQIVGEISDAQDDVQFRLAVFGAGTYHDLGAEIHIEDLCPDVSGGPKYFRVWVPDLSTIPPSPYLDDFQFKPVYLQARSNCYRLSAAFCQPISPADDWDNVGKPLRMANHPAVLDQFPWTAFFDEETATYHFTVTPTLDPEAPFPLPDSDPIDFGIVDSGVPGYSGNEIRAGFVTRFQMQGGQWSGGHGTSSSSGKLLGNVVNGSATTVEPSSFDVPAFGGGLAGVAYEWCRYEKVFEQEFGQTLFETIIYAGFVGPVPVNIWGSVGLGVRFVIESYLETRMSPFAPLPGTGNYLEMQYTLDSNLVISIPCQISAEILGGIASLAIALRPEANFQFQPYVIAGVGATPVQTDYFLQTLLSLYMEIEACIQTLILGEQCLPTISIPLIEDLPILPGHGTDQTPSSCDGTSTATLGPISAAAGGPPSSTGYGSVSQPESITSPDESTVIDIWVSADGTDRLVDIKITEDGDEVGFSVLVEEGGFFFDPVATFVSNTQVLIAGTSLAPMFTPQAPPGDLMDPGYLDIRNANVAYTEIQIARLTKVGANWELILDGLPRISDPDGTPTVDRRADGAPAIAGDPTTAEALVAWVRYQDDYLVSDGPIQLYVPFATACGSTFCGSPTSVTNIRPQMEETAIVVRRVDDLGALPGSAIEIISEPGINVQPSISYSPTGNQAYCVWLHDGTHTDLISQNTGRFIKYAVYDATTGLWSDPFDAVVMPQDYPGLLDPVIVLSGDGEGMLAFTALEPGRPILDAGLTGRSRLLFTSRLEGGVFQEPVEIRGACGEKVYGWKPEPAHIPQEVFAPGPESHLFNPEWVIFWQEFGDPGTRAGSGNVMVSTLGETATEWSPPVRLFESGERVVQSVTGTVAAGQLHTVHFDAGPGTLGALALGPPATGYQTTQRLLAPDLKITRCDLSQPHGPPGTTISGFAIIENHGLASSALDSADQSIVELEVVFIESDGTESIQVVRPVPLLRPGGVRGVPFTVELPLDPVQLEVRLASNDYDRDPSNDIARSFLGAPAPQSFAYTLVETPDPTAPDPDLADPLYRAELAWTNPVNYDRLFLYRDGRLLHTLPGSTTRFADADLAALPERYSLRGVIGASRSRRASVDVELPAQPGFVRGDANGDGNADISDAVSILDYLFVFGAEPACLASADVSFDGQVDIADAVNLLIYLFQFGPAPAAPFPTCAPSPAPSDAALGCDVPGC